LDQLAGVWERLDRALLITGDAMDALPRNHVLKAARICLLERLREHAPDKRHHQAKLDDTAFFSSTSGSTGVPKSIILTHRNILLRARGANLHCRYSGSDTVLNWLPFDHIGSISESHLRCIELGCKLVYAPKEYVLGSPLRWLDLLDKYRITHSWAPNFAYALINEHLPRALHGKWDLSCVKFLLTAGESVSLSVVETFVKKLAGRGLKKTAVRTAFGMAETGSGIMYFQPAAEETWRFFSIDRASLEGELQNAPLGHPGSLIFMSLGPAIPGISMRIVNDEKQIMPENRIGRFHVKGEAVFPGYYKDPQACRAVLLEDGWFDSGDMGFISDGHLVLTGRAKESIIVNGANYYSSEIEAAVETAEEAEVSYTAACAVHPSGSAADKLAVFFHTSVTEDIRLREVIKKIQALLTKQLGMKADYLLPVRKQDIPKTAIGKLQRSLLCKRFEAGEFKNVLKRTDILLENANTLPDWFFRKVWRHKLPLTPAPELREVPALVFMDRAGLGDFLCGKQKNCVKAEAGAAFARLSAGHYRIDPNEPGDYRRLLKSLAADGIDILRILHLWTYGEDAGENAGPEGYAKGIYSLLFLAQAQAGEGEKNVHLFVVSSNTQPVLEDDVPAYKKMPLLGLLKTIPLEMPRLACRHLDFRLDGGPDRTATHGMQVLQELQVLQGEAEIAYRGDVRRVPRLKKADLSLPKQAAPPFKTGGIYLISGGLGGISAEIAGYLLKHFQARLLLLGRTPLPERDEWPACLSQGGRPAEKIKAYQRLEQSGGEILYRDADICDPARLQAALEEAEDCWQGELDGIIHLAGVFRNCPLVRETRETLSAVLRPKVFGTQALYQLLQTRPRAVFITFSSASGFFGGAETGAYAAACAFQDAFSQCLSHKHPGRIYCFAWSMWDETGMARDSQAKDLFRANGYHIIPPDAGAYSFLAGMVHPGAQLMVGLNGGNRRLRRHMEMTPYETDGLL
ncbi:MAG: SDR family NAD(P)-dependent oxidoreductase, partial [Gammaproteobacteria bacterium]|nr:SDR family NAD(P)-dependent oxidoreductase [Gammaproteobacteria bacterium]